MRVFRATYGFRQGNGPDNFGTQTSDGIKYGVPGILMVSPEFSKKADGSIDVWNRLKEMSLMSSDFPDFQKIFYNTYL